MLIGAPRLVDMVVEHRVTHIMGKRGGGKTSLAVRLAIELCRRGYRFGSNLKCIFNEPLSAHQLGDDLMLHSVFIPDEGGLYFKQREQVDVLQAYAGKLDIVILIPSFIAPHRSARVLRIQPVWGLYSFGLPYQHYTYELRDGTNVDKGQFGWWGPEEIYGTYSRQATGGDALEILDHIAKQISIRRRREGYESDPSSLLVGRLSSTVPGFGETQSALEPGQSVGGMVSTWGASFDNSDIADEMEEKTEHLEALLVRSDELIKRARRRGLSRR